MRVASTRHIRAAQSMGADWWMIHRPSTQNPCGLRHTG
nr:MAG TPA: hypothetical protein [Caudoviricetes sp.]